VQKHVSEIKADIEKLKLESSDLDKQAEDRKNNIILFQRKLNKIRDNAYFLGDISLYHE